MVRGQTRGWLRGSSPHISRRLVPVHAPNIQLYYQLRRCRPRLVCDKCQHDAMPSSASEAMASVILPQNGCQELEWPSLLRSTTLNLGTGTLL